MFQFSDYIVTNEKRKKLFTAIYLHFHFKQADDLKDIYVYPLVRGDYTFSVIRYELNDGKSYSYVINEAQTDILAGKIREGKWSWLIKDNKTGDKRYPNNFNRIAIDLPLSFFEADQTTPSFETLVDGDFTHCEKKFLAAATVISKGIKELYATFPLIQNDFSIKRDHDLVFAFAIDKDTRSVKPSLTKIPAKLPEGGEFVIEPTPVNKEDWVSHIGAIGAIEAQEKICNKITDAISTFSTGYVNEKYKEQKDITELTKFADDLINRLWIELTHANHVIYTLTAEGGKEIIDEVANDIMERLLALPGVPGLDLNSWVTWDYTNPEEPVRYTDVDFVTEINNGYTESFVKELYTFLLRQLNPIFRPYSKKRIVPESEIGDHAIGSMRFE